MAFTSQDMRKQAEEFAALQEEFSRLDTAEKAALKALGLTEADLTPSDPATLPPALRKEMDAAIAEGKRAGQARATQSKLADAPSGPRPGAGRRGIVRL